MSAQPEPSDEELSDDEQIGTLTDETQIGEPSEPTDATPTRILCCGDPVNRITNVSDGSIGCCNQPSSMKCILDRWIEKLKQDKRMMLYIKEIEQNVASLIHLDEKAKKYRKVDNVAFACAKCGEASTALLELKGTIEVLGDSIKETRSISGNPPDNELGNITKSAQWKVETAKKLVTRLEEVVHEVAEDLNCSRDQLLSDDAREEPKSYQKRKIG